MLFYFFLFNFILMAQESFKIVVRKVERPFSPDLDGQLDWLCKCFGFFEEIDKEKTAASVFKEIIKSAEKGKLLTSTELSKLVCMSRGSVINHLNRLQRSGLIVRQGRCYSARSRSVFRTIKEIEADIDRVFTHLEETAKRIDRKFGIELRE